MTIVHANILDPDIHEPKGTAASTAGQVLTSTGGASTWADPVPAAGTLSHGMYLYQDLATATTPIPLTLAATQYQLTNDGAGTGTNTTYGLTGVGDVWDTTTNEFKFNDGTGLSLGDSLGVRIDIEATTTTANTAIDVELQLGVGGTPYTVSIHPLENFKSAGTYGISRWVGIPVIDTNTLSNRGKLWARADTSGVTVKVLNWYVEVMHTN